MSAQANGPNQTNPTWQATRSPGYGYTVEIQSAADSRYASWTELRPIPQAGGYTCDSTRFVRGANCNVSDPEDAHVYNPPNRESATWVTDATYIDALMMRRRRSLLHGASNQAEVTTSACAVTGSVLRLTEATRTP
jgi:hypothetical protein